MPLQLENVNTLWATGYHGGRLGNWNDHSQVNPGGRVVPNFDESSTEVIFNHVAAWTQDPRNTSWHSANLASQYGFYA